MRNTELSVAPAVFATTRTDRACAGAGGVSAGGSAVATGAESLTLYGWRSISRISSGLSSRASTAALLPASHSPQ